MVEESFVISDHCEGGYRYCKNMHRIAELEAQLAGALSAMLAAREKQKQKALAGEGD